MTRLSKIFDEEGLEWNQPFLRSPEYLAFDKACRDFADTFNGDLRHLSYAMFQCVNEATICAALERKK